MDKAHYFCPSLPKIHLLSFVLKKKLLSSPLLLHHIFYVSPIYHGVVTRGCAQHSVKLSKESYVSTWMGDCLGNTWLWRGSPKVSSCTLKAILAKRHLACCYQQYATPTHTHGSNRTQYNNASVLWTGWWEYWRSGIGFRLEVVLNVDMRVVVVLEKWKRF